MKGWRFLALISAIATSAHAQTTSVKPAGTYARVLQATKTQTTDKHGNNNYVLLLLWKKDEQPEAFFWRGESGWFTCDVAKAHKNLKPEPGDSWYTTEDIGAGGIKKGDTLEIIPLPGGKFEIPAEIPATAKNTLFLKTEKSGWLSLPVNNIKLKKED
jgi:hypothetical protein